MISSAPVLGSSPAYDVVESLLILGGRMAPGRWRAWAEQTRASLGSVAARRLRIWFGGDDPVGGAALALVPCLPKHYSADALISALAAVPLGDFLRLAVTAGAIAPEAPLTSDDLLALRESPVVARAYIGRYLRLNGRARAHLLWILDEPEAARNEFAASASARRSDLARCLARCLAATVRLTLFGCARCVIWKAFRQWSSRLPPLPLDRVPTIMRSVSPCSTAHPTSHTCSW